MEKVKSEDNINTLCKKLFAPETCDFPVTESKNTLKKKLVGQFSIFLDNSQIEMLICVELLLILLRIV